MAILSPVSVVLAHPRPGSLNHLLAERVVSIVRATGARVRFHDLYAEGFDPLLRADETWTSGEGADGVRTASDDPLVARHREELSEARGLCVVHPDWWGKPPAMMAGWMDRVLVPGVAYRPHEGGRPAEPLLDLRRFLVVNTAAPAEGPTDGMSDPLARTWRENVASYVGVVEMERMVLRSGSDTPPEHREGHLVAAERGAAWLVGGLR